MGNAQVREYWWKRTDDPQPVHGHLAGHGPQGCTDGKSERGEMEKTLKFLKLIRSLSEKNRQLTVQELHRMVRENAENRKGGRKARKA